MLDLTFESGVISDGGQAGHFLHIVAFKFESGVISDGGQAG